MLNDNIRPSSIDGIKRLARQIKKEKGVQHSAALDFASKAGCFQNYTDARRKLRNQPHLYTRQHRLFLTMYWHDNDSHQGGRETLEIQLSKPLLELCTKSDLKRVRGLINMRLVAGDHLVSDALGHTRSYTREMICTAERSLRFMEFTGLKPSKNSSAAYPDGTHKSKLPNIDHATHWYDPENDQFILADEPYGSASIDAKRLLWATQYGWNLRKSSWPGMYSPYSCDLFLAADSTQGYDFDALMKKVDDMPHPLTADQWKGVSVLSLDTFVSPAAKTPQDRRRAKSKGTVISQPSRHTTPYSQMFGALSRKPIASMPVSDHADAGKIIKSVLQSSEKPFSVFTKMNSLRSTLEDWMSSEIKEDQLTESEFFDVYYREVDQEGPYADAAGSSAGLVRILGELKLKLKNNYPNCEPLRKQIGKIDSSISLIKKFVDGNT